MPSHRVDIDMTEVHRLVRMPDRHPFLSAAVDAVVGGVLINQMQVIVNGGAPGPAAQRQIDFFLKRQLGKVVYYMLAVGFVPVTIARGSVYGKDDEEMQKVYNGKVPDEVDVGAFVIPDTRTFKMYGELDDNEQRVFVTESTQPRRPKVHIVQSVRHLGFDLESGEFSTPLARLRRPLESLLAFEEEAEQIRKMNALPPIFVERVPATESAALANMRMRRVGEAIEDMSDARAFIPDAENDAQAVAVRSLESILKAQAAGEIIPAEDRLIFLPERTRLVANGVAVRPTPELERERAQFLAFICAVFHVPSAMIVGADARGVGNQQSKVSSDSDMQQMQKGYEMVRDDLIHFCQSVLPLILDNVVTLEIKLAIRALATPEQLTEFYHGGGFEDHEDWRHFYAAQTGIPADTVRKGRGAPPRLPKRLDKADDKRAKV